MSREYTLSRLKIWPKREKMNSESTYSSGIREMEIVPRIENGAGFKPDETTSPEERR